MTDWNDNPGAEGLDVAVIAMNGRFPGAPDVGRFWRNLRDGVESITFHSLEELIARGADPAMVKAPSYVPASALVDDVDLFDAGFFGFSPREAETMDPQQRVFLECAWEALEQAGYDSQREPGLIGVYAASGTNEYLFFHLLPNLTDLQSVLQLSISNEKDFLATRVSYELDLRGPSINVQTGCSSGLVAVHLACQALLAYQCDMALAGGISLQVSALPGYPYQQGGILSPDGHCRAFSADAQGTIASSGAGVVVLKRLADAIAGGDTIHAVIKGSALNNDGGGKIGYTAPSIEGQARVIDMAHAAAAVDPRSISYVEGHGSGTPLGDPIEVSALTRAFRAGTEDRQFCALGSVKSNIGHTDTAAGMAGLIKTVLALEHGEIPPTLGFTQPNPQIDLAASPFYVNSERIAWPDAQPRRAGVSSFGIGGTNAHVVLEEAPQTAPSGPPRPWDLLVLSARSEAALEKATDRLAEALTPSENLSDIAWTLQAGRRRFAHRRVLVCRDGDGADAARTLRERDPRRLLGGFDESGDRPVAFLFPGLGDHYPGMAAGLYRDEPVFRREIDRAADFLEPFLGKDLRTLLVPPEAGTEAAGGIDFKAMLGRTDPLAGSELARTAIAQPALFAVELALARLWMSWGLRPAALLGYSLGEYVAACVAGVLSEDDALRVVAERARLIEALPAGAMLAVALPEEETAPLLAQGLSIAAVNGPALTVVAGVPEEVDRLARTLAERGVATRTLPTTHAFHSRMMEPVAGAVRELLAGVRLRAPEIPYVSNVTGTWITEREATDPGAWVAHMLRPVRFGPGLAELWRDPARALLEVGPGQGLGSLALQHSSAPAGDRVVVPSLRGAWEKQPDGAVLLGALGKLWIAGCRIDWAGFHGGERRRRVPLPTYPFERQRYWVGAPSGGFRLPVAPALHEPGAPETPVALAAAPAAPRYARPALRTPWVAPATELESAVAGLWERLLGIGGIGVHDNFFELGGHSLLGTALVNLAREVLGTDLPLQALFETPTVAGMTAAVAAARGAAGQALPLAPLSPVARTGDLPLSYAQARMWFLHQLEPASPAYNIPFAVRLTGTLDPAALIAAVREIARRHETLRTAFPAVAGKAAQVIAPPAAAEALQVPLLDLGGLPPEARESELARIGDLSARLPFDLAQLPLLRLALVRLSAAADAHALLLCMHHIISDGWSIGVFVGEMATLYEDFRQGRTPSLPPLPLQYADFADWQSRWLSGEILEKHLAWWRERLAGRPAALDLPTDRPRGEQQGSRAGHRDLTLPGGLGRALRALAEGAGATPYIVFLAAFDTVLARYARQADVSVGTPIANRTRAEVAGLIGFFVNTLVLRVDLGGDGSDLTFRELVARAAEVALGAFAHQDLPFEKLVEELHPERALSVTPLFQVMLAYQNAPLPYVELPGLTLQGLASETAAAMFDLTLTVGEIGAGQDAGGFSLSLEYARALFDAATADRMLGHLARFLERALADPDRRLSDLPMLAASERDQLLREWNATTREIADPAAAHHLVARQAALRPDALAIAGGDLDLTYGELTAWASHLAPVLRELGAGPEAPVAVFLERSARLVVAELAALLAGAPYLPLDPSFPPDRLATLLEGAGASVILTREGLRDRLPATGAQVVPLDSPSFSSLASFSSLPSFPTNLAYLIFTSGSTGVPKGIEVTHASLTNLIAWYHETYAPGPEDRAALIAGPSFDVSVGEIWPLLAAGASLHVPDDETRLSPDRLLAWLARERITLCFLPTPLAEAVLRELPAKLPPGLALRALLTAGDNLVRTPPPGLPFELFDQYGPAEATVFATRAHIVPGPTGPAGPPIGRPLTNYQAYVLDPWLEPAPVAVPGEIYLGGAGLARGYRGRPDLTAERFLPNPFAPGDRLYRTGDLARWLPSGELEFLGRIDRQVKVRGFRIELGEVEAALMRLPGVAAAAVLHGEARLVAYVAPPAGQPAPTALELRRTLRTRLPEYMVPAVFVALPELPLSASGKIDRDALPEPAQSAAAERVAPRTPVEEELARIWSDLLGVPYEKLSISDNFFDLGGHSLLAAQCVAQVRESLGAELPLQSLFGNATLGDIADALVEAELASAGEDELRELLAEYDGLSEDELRELLAGGDQR
ncbi:MAG TPA: amino acid adenylation domain-containing protein [Thermoanaerobaculia bacterium]|nr:amino acid adenylation domain-containing protein [Thermoanaerobaculia bacterium]